MLLHWRNLLVVLVGLISFNVFSTNILITELNKSSDNQWTVNYRSKKPITSVQFAVTPDSSRHSRWSLIDEGFEFKELGGKDTVFRRDGKSFFNVSFTLSPTYTSLPKNYAPFSPFSDGSILFHSARFFACSELCSGMENLWYIKFNAPIDDVIVLNGQQTYGEASWYDKNEGRKVYVGKLKPNNFNGLLAVIDPELPAEIKAPLHKFLPQALDYLSEKFQPLSSQPMLFASFGQTDDDHYGRQGGVLPNQVFMHWYGKILKTDPYDLLWFFAHEAAHIFQDLQGMRIDSKEAWIHEGHAEFIAAHLLLTFHPKAKDYVENRIQSSIKTCRSKLIEMPLNQFALNGQFKSLYDCGLMFFSLMTDASQQADIVAFDIWKAFGQQEKNTVINTDLVKYTMRKFIDVTSAAQITKEMGW